MSKDRYRILAMDVDGTLLDSDGQLRSETIEAVARAAKAGIRPVLCTGRRYRRALPVARQLGIDSPLVCNSGSIVKDVEGHQTLWRADLSDSVLDEVFSLFRIHDELAISFTDRSLEDFDFLVARMPTGRHLFDEYLDRNRPHARVDPDWMSRVEFPHFHLCAIGTEIRMVDFEAAILNQMPGQVQTFVQKSPRYSGTMCEVLRQDANKWTALLHLASQWGIDPAEICAVGDDRNDVPMLRGAGLGVAMGHAGPEVLASANLVTGSNDEGGLASLIDKILLA